MCFWSGVRCSKLGQLWRVHATLFFASLAATAAWQATRQPQVFANKCVTEWTFCLNFLPSYKCPPLIPLLRSMFWKYVFIMYRIQSHSKVSSDRHPTFKCVSSADNFQRELFYHRLSISYPVANFESGDLVFAGLWFPSHRVSETKEVARESNWTAAEEVVGEDLCIGFWL